jgi:GAF domain-containing protein
MHTVSTQLSDRLTALEQENAALRSRLQSCECSQAKLQPDLSGSTLEHRLLEATATVANTLLMSAPFDRAINTALQIIGEALDSDRINVIENFNHPSDSSFPYWRVLYEWDSPGTVPQFSDPDTAQGSYEEIRCLYDLMRQGKTTSYLIEDAPEPFRSKQAAIGVKSTHVVAISVEGEWWGVVGVDDCREAKHHSPVALAVLKVVADCIGSAIQRDRNQQALVKAEQARSQELERHNTELQQTLDRLAQSEESFRTLFELSSEGFYYTEINPPCPVSLLIEEQCDLLYQNIRVVKANPAFAAMYGVDNPDELIGLRNTDVHIASSKKKDAFIRGTIENGYRFRNLETEEIDTQGRLRYFLNSGIYTIRDDCVISAWSTQVDITELRETQKALLQAEQARSQELAKANEVLKKSLNSLATEPSLDKFLGQVLGAIAEQFNSPLAEYWYHPENTAFVGMMSWQGQIYNREEISKLHPTHPGVDGFQVPPEMIHGEDIHHRKQYFIIEDWFNNPFTKDYTWHPENGLYKEINVPMILGDECIGALIVPMSREHQITTQQIELAQALAHQATLAVQLTRLAEEAKLAAIAREQEKAASERAAELAKANAVLRGATDRLANEPSLEAFLGHILAEACQEAIETGAIFLYDEHSECLSLVVSHGIADYPYATPQFLPVSKFRGWSILLQTKQPLVLDMDEHPDLFGEGTLDWHLSQGHQGIVVTALMLGDRPLGMLGIAFRSKFTFRAADLECSKRWHSKQPWRFS